MLNTGEPENATALDAWSTADFVFASRALSEEFPQRSATEIGAGLRAAEQILPSSQGRVRLVQLAREILRKPATAPRVDIVRFAKEHGSFDQESAS